MAGSLLTSMGLPELITFDIETYERRAIELASNQTMFAALRAKTADARKNSPLFDMPRFVRHFEDAVSAQVKRPG